MDPLRGGVLNHATVLAPDARIRSLPNGQFGSNSTAAGGHDQITFKAWDRSDGLASGTTGVNTDLPGSIPFGFHISPYGGAGTSSIFVADVNDAPVLTGVDDFPTIRADNLTSNGTFPNGLGNLIVGHESDVDLDSPIPATQAAPKPVAIIGQDAGNGTWQFLDGGVTWRNIGPVSNTSALLITSQAVRFVPNGHDGTTASLTLRAWDTYHNLNLTGTYADVSINGGTTPYSTQTATTHIIVTPTVKTSALSLASSTAIYGGTTTLTAILQTGGTPIANALVTFTRSDNSLAGTAFTNSNGVAVLSNVSIAGLNVGTSANAFSASFAGDSAYTASTTTLRSPSSTKTSRAWSGWTSTTTAMSISASRDCPGVPVTLTNSAGQTIAQTTTDANGLYIFNHVAPIPTRSPKEPPSQVILKGKTRWAVSPICRET